MIELQDVTKYYDRARALGPIRMTFERGKTTVLIGPSGCGKSTILRLINGLIVPSSGTVSIDGAVIEPRTLLELRRRMGYVIQDGGLFPHLTAFENAALLARHLGWASERIHVRIREVCALTHFDESLLGRYPSELSGGQRQRVSLMRALMLDPEVLLLDEPLAALDPMVRASLQSELKQIFAALGKTVILVTHDLPEAAYLADTIVLMKEGTLVQTGSIGNLQSNPASEFVTNFIAAQRSLASI